MSIPTVAINEATPAGGNYVREGDNRIREHKKQVREIMEVDHNYQSSGQDAAAGQHKQMTLVEAADIGTGAEGVPILGAQTEDGGPELVYTDEDDNDVQITKDGYLDATSLGGVYPAANLAALATMMALIYPVGIVITLGVATDPADLLGIGTWAAIEGKVIVGKAAAGTFNTLDGTGGAETVTLDTTMMPAHTHTVGTTTNNQGGASDDVTEANVAGAGSVTTSSTGDGGAHANLQPYIVKYVWQRTA